MKNKRDGIIIITGVALLYGITQLTGQGLASLANTTVIPMIFAYSPSSCISVVIAMQILLVAILSFAVCLIVSTTVRTLNPLPGFLVYAGLSPILSVFHVYIAFHEAVKPKDIIVLALFVGFSSISMYLAYSFAKRRKKASNQQLQATAKSGA